jgi:predicted O-methyltransferase YrrM
VIHYLWRKNKLTKLARAVANVKVKYVEVYYNEANLLYKQVQRRLEPYKNFPLGGMLSPFRAPIVYVLCRAIKPRIVVETGVASGVSTTFILDALWKNRLGKLYSLDLPPPYGEQTLFLPEGKVGWLVPDELKSKWDLVLGKTSETLTPLLYKLNRIDMFLHDSEHTYENMMYEMKTAWPFLSPRGILFVDDAKCNTAFSDFCNRVKPIYIDYFNEFGVAIKGNGN